MPNMPATSNSFWTFYKIARWLALAALVIVVLLVLKDPHGRPAPLPPEQAKASADSFSTKLASLETARSHHESTEAHFTADEINSSVASPETADAIRSQAQHAGQPGQPVTTEAAAAENLKSTQINFEGDQVTGYFVTPVYGKDLQLQISGRLGAQDGYVTFEPTSFKVGDLSIPVALVNPALQKKLQEPETREKLRLPDFVSGLRVENGELVISEKPAL